MSLFFSPSLFTFPLIGLVESLGARFFGGPADRNFRPFFYAYFFSSIFCFSVGFPCASVFYVSRRWTMKGKKKEYQKKKGTTHTNWFIAVKTEGAALFWKKKKRISERRNDALSVRDQRERKRTKWGSGTAELKRLLIRHAPLKEKKTEQTNAPDELQRFKGEIEGEKTRFELTDRPQSKQKEMRTKKIANLPWRIDVFHSDLKIWSWVKLALISRAKGEQQSRRSAILQVWDQSERKRTKWGSGTAQ